MRINTLAIHAKATFL